jgi:hypothetical protein
MGLGIVLLSVLFNVTGHGLEVLKVENLELKCCIFQVSYNPIRFAANPAKYFVPYFTNYGEGPLGAVSGFDAIGNIR